MFKEVIFSIIIIVFIFLGNGITENYTKESIEETSNYLIELKDELSESEEEKNPDIINDKIKEIHEKWDERYEKLAYYIEHDELEKVETELTDVQARIKTENYSEAIPEVDKCVFILRHIKEKYAFNLKNIF